MMMAKKSPSSFEFKPPKDRKDMHSPPFLWRVVWGTGSCLASNPIPRPNGVQPGGQIPNSMLQSPSLPTPTNTH